MNDMFEPWKDGDGAPTPQEVVEQSLRAKQRLVWSGVACCYMLAFSMGCLIGWMILALRNNANWLELAGIVLMMLVTAYMFLRVDRAVEVLKEEVKVVIRFLKLFDEE